MHAKKYGGGQEWNWNLGRKANRPAPEVDVSESFRVPSLIILFYRGTILRS